MARLAGRFGGLFAIGPVAGIMSATVMPVVASEPPVISGAPVDLAIEAPRAIVPVAPRAQPQAQVVQISNGEALQARRPVKPRPQAVTLAFAGDVMFGGMIAPQLAADPGALLDGVAPLLRRADLAVVNLETAITQRGTAEPKEYTFRAPPTALVALRSAGVDVASLANNPGMDFGPVGLQDTLQAAGRERLPLVGAGVDAAAAYAPWVSTINGRRIALLAATQVMDSVLLDTWPAQEDRAGLASAKEEHVQRLLDAVRAAGRSADIVVVYLHWGVERETCPTVVQQDLAARLAEAGADVIVGGHAHRLQGAGMLGKSLVAYGLGNFVFYAGGGAGAESGVLRVTVDPTDRISYDWKPARLVAGIPQPLAGDEARVAAAQWEGLRACTGLAAGE
jgi:poly-gamma-glutamate capsule biosynthesis protein CapA/YwtB (metallophosphatase superfamily)